jgi:hypothetical protein
MPEVARPFWAITLMTIVTHTVTYFIAGILALYLFDYREQFADPEFAYPMRLVTDPFVAAGPIFQPIRGLLFGAVFYLLRNVLFRAHDGWVILWALLGIIGILNTFGPAPGSIEGMIFTTPSVWSHIKGLPETVFQTFLLSTILWYWVRNTQKHWITWLMLIAFVLVLAMSVLGVLQATGRLLP